MNFKAFAISAGIVVLELAAGPSSAATHGTSLFASEANARSVCGAGKVVWAVLDSYKYYRPGSPGYEWGKGEGKGAYTCEKVARSHGWQVAKEVS